MARFGKGSRDDSARGEALWPIRSIWIRSPHTAPAGPDEEHPPAEDRPGPTEQGPAAAGPPPSPRPRPNPSTGEFVGRVRTGGSATLTRPVAGVQAPAGAQDPAAGPDRRVRQVPPETVPPETVPPRQDATRDTAAGPDPEPPAPAARRRPLGQPALLLATVLAGWLIVTQLPPLLAQDAGEQQASAGPAEVRPVSYRSFADPAGLTLAGGATRAGAAIRLAEGPDQSGAIWSAYRIDPARSISTAFRFTSTGRSGSISFLLQTRGADAGTQPADLRPRLAVDFDQSDPAGKIVVTAVDGDGAGLDLGDAAPGVDLGGGAVTVWIDILAGEKMIKIYGSAGTAKPATPMFSARLDVSLTLGTGPVYAGLAAATTARTGTHEAMAWHLAGTPAP